MKDLSFLKEFKYTHRGLHDNLNGIPENSVKAFKKAISNGYAIELDIRITKDLKWVCFHDKNLFRMTNEDININKIIYNELKNIKLTNSNESIPLLSDVLNLVNGIVPLLIEIKPVNIKHLNSLMDILNNYEGKYALFSFSPLVVNYLKRKHPNVIRGQISSFFDDEKYPKFIKWFYKSMIFNKINKPDFISYNINNLPNKYVDKFKKNKNVITLGYTAKNKEQYKFDISYLDNVVFEGFKV